MKDLPVDLNLLKLLEWEPKYRLLFHGHGPESPSRERLLKFLCPFGAPSELSALRTRYETVSEVDRDVWFSIGEPKIRENVFEPLRQAKANYVLGNYLASIALCGIVAEKMAILLHSIHIDDEPEREKFEKKLQSDRVKLLKGEQLIGEQSVKDFGDIRQARRAYLHHWNAPEELIAKRALQAYAATVRLFLVVISVEIIDGVVILNPKLIKYLIDRGVLREGEDSE